MLGMLKRLWTDEDGAAAAEYALILGLAALAIIVGARTLGTAVNTMFNDSATAVNGANTTQ